MRTAHEEFQHSGFLCIVKRVGTFGEWHAIADRFDINGKVIGSLQTGRYGGAGAKAKAKADIIAKIERCRKEAQEDAQ